MVSVGTSEGCCTGPTVVALAGALMLNETRPLMTWPSVPMRRQRAVTLPDKSGGKSKTISLSVDPCRGAARATRTRQMSCVPEQVAECRRGRKTRPRRLRGGDGSSGSGLLFEVSHCSHVVSLLHRVEQKPYQRVRLKGEQTGRWRA